MRRLPLLCAFLVFAGTPALAKTPAFVSSIASHVASRMELSAGYSYFNFEQTLFVRDSMNGWQLGADFRMTNWLYVAAELNGEYGTQSSVYPTMNGTRVHLYPYLVGPRIYVLKRKRRVSPFLEGLVGRVHGSLQTPPAPPLPQENEVQSVLAWAAGFGADYRVSKRWLIRGEADYISADVFQTTAKKNVRGSISIVYQLGAH